MKVSEVNLCGIDENVTECEDLRSLYETAFPAEERRPWREFASMPREFTFFRIVADGKECGLFTLWRFEDFAYIEHFAILPELRGNGIGAQVLKLAAEAAAGLPLVLEVEPADAGEQAKRRIAFYCRCGFTLHDDFHYMQPPYAGELPPVCLNLMTNGFAGKLEAVARTLHTKVYGQPGKIA